MENEKQSIILKLVALISKFSEIVGCMVNTQKSVVFLYISSN